MIRYIWDNVIDIYHNKSIFYYLVPDPRRKFLLDQLNFQLEPVDFQLDPVDFQQEPVDCNRFQLISTGGSKLLPGDQ